jgi:hypothetical protein
LGYPGSSSIKWFGRFNQSLENVESLQDQSRAPYRKRRWEVTLTQEVRIKRLREKHIHYGKKKLKILYEKEYNEAVSCQKIERVIRRHRLYLDRIRQERIARKQARTRQNPKKRINQLKKENRLWFLLQLDTIVIYWDDLKRYILAAVDYASKFGYASPVDTKLSTGQGCVRTETPVQHLIFSIASNTSLVIL